MPERDERRARIDDDRQVWPRLAQVAQKLRVAVAEAFRSDERQVRRSVEPGQQERTRLEHIFEQRHVEPVPLQPRIHQL